eukprot:781802_1
MSELLARKKVNNVYINRHTIKNTQYWSSAIPPAVTSPADEIDRIYNNPVILPANDMDSIHGVTPHIDEINPIYNDPVMSPARILQYLRNKTFIVKNEIQST